MKPTALVLLGVVALSGCNHILGHQIEGSGKSATRQITVGSGKEIPAFKRISTHGAYDIEVRQGPQSNVAITGDDNIVKLVDLKVNGDELNVKLDGSYSTRIGLKLVVTMPEVQGVEINGSGNANVSGLSGKSFKAEINGSGNIDVSGKADSLDASISGSGEINATNLEVQDASASVSGSGTVMVWAAKMLTADLTGSGDVRYKGKPKVNKNVTGSGDVTKL